MKKKIALMVLTATALAGCGRDRSGNYQGTETSIIYGGAPFSQEVTIALTESEGENVYGQWQGASGAGYFTGVMKSDRIENVTLQRNDNTMAQTLIGGSYSAYSWNTGAYPATTGTSTTTPTRGCTGSFVGTLMITDDGIMGALQAPTQTTANLTQQYSTVNSGCSEIRIQAMKK